MPTEQVNGLAMHYTADGPVGAPVITFAHAQGFDARGWAAQAAGLSDTYRLLCIDSRGFGSSELGQDDFSIEDLASDVVGLLDALDIKRTHYAGSSLGGMVGLALALDHPGRLASLILVATQGQLPEASIARVRDNIAAIRAAGTGMEARTDATLDRYLPDDYAAANPEDFARLRAMMAAISAETYAKSAEAIVGMDFDDRLGEITLPTYVIAGALDAATPPDRMTLYRDRIASARMDVIAGAGHFPNYEKPSEFNALLRDFVASVEA